MYPCRVLRFPATHRSAFERIQAGDPVIRQAAFAEIVEGYWRPSYYYLRLQWRLTLILLLLTYLIMRALLAAWR